ILWLHAGTWIPTGNPETDRAVRPRADFMAFYASGTLIRQSPAQLYDLDRQAEAETAATGLDLSRDDPDFLPLVYPTILAVIFAPFTIFSYKAAYALVILVNFLLLGLIVQILENRLDLDRGQSQMLVLCATALAPIYAVLLQGQVSFIVLLLFVL